MLPPLPFALLLLLIQQPPTISAASSDPSDLHDNSPSCNCYVVSSGPSATSPTYFQYHRFWDFRHLASSAFDSAPPLVNATQDQGHEAPWQPQIFNAPSFLSDWEIQNWSKPATDEFPVRMVNSPANVYVTKNLNSSAATKRGDQADPDDDAKAESMLVLRTTRLDGFQSAAEMENLQRNLKFASLRVRARVRGAKGAVAGFFTYKDDDNESDVEILTRDAEDVIRYTNQPSVSKSGDAIPQSSFTKPSLPSWHDFHTHRIDWIPKLSAWFLDNTQTATNTYSVPRKPSNLILNMWSDGGEWSGNMSVGESAEFQILWVQMVFNVSGPVAGKRGVDEDEDGEGEGEGWGLEKRGKKKRCEVVCKIDDVDVIGTPVVVSVNRGGAAGLVVPWCVGLLALGLGALWVA